MKKRALVSVSDKTGIVEVCSKLVEMGYELISTGGTMATIAKAGLPVMNISEITDFPECLDGRVKTLHPAVHAGLLAMRDNPEHMAQLDKLNIDTIDVVIVNLYPFKQTVMAGKSFAEAVENIDIGGPTMLRSAAKNYKDVVVLIDPNDYNKVLDEMASGAVSIETRTYLMYKVYQHTAVYDSMIASYLRNKIGIEYPDQLTLAFERVDELRYGENPHQSAAFYREAIPVGNSLAEAKQLNGKQLSFNNINDANGALALLKEFDRPAAVAIKHTNPCGVAQADTIYEAYKKAHDSDPVSVFGGIVALNGEVDERTAEELTKTFLEIVIAPSFSEKAVEILSKKQNLRLLVHPEIALKDKGGYEFKKVYGGLLVQQSDRTVFGSELKVVTKIQPTEAQLADMEFAMKVVKHCKSNAIVVVKDGCTLGIGVGQTNRIWATNQAIEHSLTSVEGAVLGSDAFFPFDDCVTAASKAGIAAIVQPGGSKRDEDSIIKADECGITMVFSGERHFKH
ncbi:MAG: bifunctional phosphoribosylaminoimidazolecarboxamide formyltransferase/IMP cyclohydrolase [Clostridia bacterium]|nr:bifunctional phosphoribosylaminoimidazolecarboxamide formyltransferase/IMP cyclohydrolase [Clostridia bacterium]